MPSDKALNRTSPIMKMYLRKTEGLSNFSFTRHETTTMRFGEDVPANDNRLFYDVVSEGEVMGFECETEDDAIELYEYITSGILWFFNERGTQTHDVIIVGTTIEGEEISRKERVAFIDSTSDAYDHGQCDYYNSRI